MTAFSSLTGQLLINEFVSIIVVISLGGTVNLFSKINTSIEKYIVHHCVSCLDAPFTLLSIVVITSIIQVTFEIENIPKYYALKLSLLRDRNKSSLFLTFTKKYRHTCVRLQSVLCPKLSPEAR